ncbi:MAG: DUF4065 domain-containing protein [bacterium]|nr:DUF4065 domain-containing protein [bacterium]
MVYSAKAIANAFLEIAARKRETLDPLKLQKLIYYANGWHLGLRGAPLIDEFIEAWPYGPVIPSLYHEFKEFGGSPIQRHARDFDRDSFEIVIPNIDDSDQFVQTLLEKIWEVYGGFTSLKLSNMSHRPDSPWAKSRAKNPSIQNIQITNNTIQKYFSALAQGE